MIGADLPYITTANNQASREERQNKGGAKARRRTDKRRGGSSVRHETNVQIQTELHSPSEARQVWGVYIQVLREHTYPGGRTRGREREACGQEAHTHHEKKTRHATSRKRAEGRRK